MNRREMLGEGICSLAGLSLLKMSARADEAADDATTAATQFELEPYVNRYWDGGASILCVTKSPARVRVEYGPQNDLKHTAYDIRNGMILAAGVTRHCIRIDNLDPKGDTYYRVAAEPLTKFKTYYGSEYGPEFASDIRPLPLLAATDKSCRAIVMNDTHNRDALIGSALAQTDGKFDLAIGVGDIINDPPSEERTISLMRNIHARLRDIPFLLVRGNHECRGEYANRLDKHYDLPDGKFYGAFTAGPIRFIILDDGEDKPDDNVSYSRLAMFEQYRAEQAEWLKREVNRPEFKQAAHRVVLIHIPLYFDESDLNKWTCHTLRERIMPTLTESGIDLVLSGHTHRSRHIAAGTFPGQNFDIFVGGGPKSESATYGILEAEGDRLAYHMHAIDGRLLAEYRKG